MDTPRSGNSQTRFSTPVSDLDDHRFQPSSLPRTDIIGSSHMGLPIQRGTTQRSVCDDDNFPARSDLLQVNEALRESGSSSRDFEQAIIDDNRSINGSIRGIRVDGMHVRRGSIATATGRRGTNRRGQQEKVSRSRGSSVTSRSNSPPNSVDAFANPRRRERAGTVGSKAPSEFELSLHRTVSGGTHRRRPTFTEGDAGNLEGREEVDSTHDAAEEDVCFPPPEEKSKTYTIDFEELEEFIAENARGRTQMPDPRRRKHSLSSQSHKPKIFHDLRQNGAADHLSKIVTHNSSPSGTGSDDALEEQKSDLAEKYNDLLAQPHASDRRPSQVEQSRFSFFSSELESTVHAPDLGDLLMPGESFRDLFQLDPEGGVWWLDVQNPSEEELTAISRAFSIHPLTNEDIRTQETREKVELFRQYYFVCFRSFLQMDKTSVDYMKPINIYVVVFKEGVLSFTFSQSPHAANVRKRIGKLRDTVALSADWICYALIDDIVDAFGPVIREIERETDMIEDQVFVARAADLTPLLRQIGECRKKVMSLMRLLGGKADVIKGFAKRCNEQFGVTPRGDIGLYLGDVQDHVVTMMSNLGHFEKMLSRSHSNYLAQLSVDSIAQGNKANRVLAKITMIATVLVPLNLITGLFGMNVNVPGKNSEGLSWFGGIVGVICAIVLCSLVIAKRYKFI
ncbi:MAG: Mg(2+) transporter [Pycnora praestabilis]|nr:MAG: Mg(2+) transporter [Pycnora praestabilis]